jgi:hypothetical protein
VTYDMAGAKLITRILSKLGERLHMSVQLLLHRVVQSERIRHELGPIPHIGRAARWQGWQGWQGWLQGWLHSVAELLLCSSSLLDRPLLYVKAPTTHMAVSEPTDLDRSFAIWALDTRSIRNSTRWFHLT